MFKQIGEIIQKRIKDLHINDGLDEQIVLSLVEDFLKQNEFFLCIPKSFKNGELLIICTKAVIANELNDQKEKIFNFLKEECSNIKVEKIKIVINNSI